MDQCPYNHFIWNPHRCRQAACRKEWPIPWKSAIEFAGRVNSMGPEGDLSDIAFNARFAPSKARFHPLSRNPPDQPGKFPTSLRAAGYYLLRACGRIVFSQTNAVPG
jgi:hypothetical protein